MDSNFKFKLNGLVVEIDYINSTILFKDCIYNTIYEYNKIYNKPIPYNILIDLLYIYDNKNLKRNQLYLLDIIKSLINMKYVKVNDNGIEAITQYDDKVSIINSNNGIVISLDVDNNISSTTIDNISFINCNTDILLYKELDKPIFKFNIGNNIEISINNDMINLYIDNDVYTYSIEYFMKINNKINDGSKITLYKEFINRDKLIYYNIPLFSADVFQIIINLIIDLYQYKDIFIVNNGNSIEVLYPEIMSKYFIRNNDNKIEIYNTTFHNDRIIIKNGIIEDLGKLSINTDNNSIIHISNK